VPFKSTIRSNLVSTFHIYFSNSSQRAPKISPKLNDADIGILRIVMDGILLSPQTISIDKTEMVDIAYFLASLSRE
jgi:hypothetical protein